MEAMYDTARDHEDQEVELSCPQCRGSIANMQLSQRLDRWMRASPAGIGCSEEAAHELIAYENLIAETVHLCECEDDGHPYFMWSPSEVARVMSRDEICNVVEARQGRASGNSLRRMLRSEVRRRPPSVLLPPGHSCCAVQAVAFSATGLRRCAQARSRWLCSRASTGRAGRACLKLSRWHRGQPARDGRGTFSAQTAPAAPARERRCCHRGGPYSGGRGCRDDGCSDVRYVLEAIRAAGCHQQRA